MGPLDVYYLREHGDKPITVSTLDEVDVLIEQVRSESHPQAPIRMDVHLSGDPYSQGLDVGIARDHGLVRYAGRDWPRGVVSTNGEPRKDGEVPYFYMDVWEPYPTNSEIPLDLVSKAGKEFMTTDGARPTSIEWQPGLL